MNILHTIDKQPFHSRLSICYSTLADIILINNNARINNLSALKFYINYRSSYTLIL